MHVRFNSAHRAFDNQFDADRRGQVNHGVALIDQLGSDWLVLHRVDGVMKIRMALQMFDIANAAGRKIVKDKDLIASLQISVSQM